MIASEVALTSTINVRDNGQALTWIRNREMMDKMVRRIANRGGSSQVSWNRVLGYSDAGWCWWLQMCDTRDKILQDTIFIWLLKAKRVFSSFAKTCPILFQNKEESTMEGICRRRADNADTTYAPA